MNKELTGRSLFLERIKSLCDGKEGHPDNLVDLAKRVDVASNSIYKWNSQKPTYDKVFEVAKQLGTSVEWLVEG